MSTPYGYPVKRFAGETKRYVQTLSLRDNPELIREYRRLHSPEAFWREIGEGIRQAGVLEMEIYIHHTTLCMLVELPAEADFDEVMQRMGTMPRQTEWEATVAQYQQCAADASSAGKWTLMERMFRLY